MIRTIRFAGGAAVLGLMLAAAACNNDTLNRPFSFTAIDPLFERYVSMGNSLTAGFQSGGINDSTQQQSYAVQLARAMHAPFFVPSLTKPGCPPPFTNVWTGARVTPTGYPPSTATSCYLRNIPSEPPPYISNTAVPGAKVEDLYANLDTASSANSLTQFILGGLTQVQMMRKAQPTFVSVWIGNNDILGAATSATNPGDSTKITSLANFQARYSALIDSIKAAGPKGAILIGVANVTEIPYFSAGATYWAIKNGLVPGSAFPPAFTVSANCAPAAAIPGVGRGDTTLVPFPYGAALLGAAAAGAPRNLDCSDSVAAIVTPPELRKLVATDSAYNLFISAQATAHGWAYFSPNGALDSLRTLAQPNTVVRAFPLIGQACSANPFGTAFSCDGVHASAATHKLIANHLRVAINATYSTSIPVIP
ncbi:MAG TPA: SGNH/GDSL hydrolase family protein [Gemmatimonadales bacterium]|nr:SGNH/GDSL hydrolase family protein [Gemmatimonadales bacterium]